MFGFNSWWVSQVTWTVGSSATEEGHITVIWSCECGSTVNETMQCAGSFCPQSSGTLQSAEALPLNDGSCNSPSSEVAFDPQNDDLTTSPAQLYVWGSLPRSAAIPFQICGTITALPKVSLRFVFVVVLDPGVCL
mgnify:CR=1 FL=1